MRKLLTSAAVAFAVLASGAAHAAPTCHQKVAVTKDNYFSSAFKLSSKIKKMTQAQALDLISSTADDRDDKATAFATAVADATAKTLKTTVNDDIKGLLSDVSDSLFKDYKISDQFTKDAVANNGVKALYISNATMTIITGFFVCK